MEKVSVLSCLLLASIAVQVTSTYAACDCSRAMAAVQVKMRQLELSLHQQRGVIDQLKRTNEADRVKLQKHEDMLAGMTQGVGYQSINNSRINHLHLHVTANDFTLTDRAAPGGQDRQQGGGEGLAGTVRQHNRTLREHARRIARLEAHRDNHANEIPVRPSPGPSTESVTTGVPAAKARVDLTVTSPDGSRYGPVVALPGGEALVADRGPDPDRVVRLDRQGRVAPSAFTCRTRREITGMVLDGGDLYVLQYNGTVSRVALSRLNQTRAEWRVPGVHSVYPGASLGTELYLVDFDNDTVFSFNLLTRRKTIRKTSLVRPGSLSTASHTDGGRLFVVSEYSGHRVSVFTSTWNLTSAAGSGRPGRGDGQLYHPWQVLATPWSTLLVADTYNDRVSEFSLSGRWLRHLLTSRDGLYQPLYVSYSRPYLWVVHRSRGRGPRTVRRYHVAA